MHEDIKQAYHAVLMFLLIVAAMACLYWAVRLLPESPISPGEKRFKQLEARVEAIEATITKGHDRGLEAGLLDKIDPLEHFFEEDK